MVQHGRVFTPGPAPGNPYTIQLERYYQHILSTPAKSGNGAKQERVGARPAWVFTQLVVVPPTSCVQGALHPLDQSQGMQSQAHCNNHKPGANLYGY